MRLGANQLQSRLSRSPLAPVYLISGDEPLQRMECADAIRQAAREQGFSERRVFDVDAGFDWNELLEAGNNLSLFGDRQLLECRLGNSKPGKEGGAVLMQYCEQASPDHLLIITAGRLDKRTRQSKWYKSIDGAGVTIQVWPVSIRELAGWMQQRTKQAGKTLTSEAADLLAERVEGNLLAADQEIRKLCLLVDKDTIDVAAIGNTVADSTRFDVFDMVASSLAGDSGRAIRMLDGLRSEGAEPVAILGALMWEFRRLNQIAWEADQGATTDSLFSKFRIWDNRRKQAIKTALRRHDRQALNELLRAAGHIDRMVKSNDRLIAWDHLQLLLLSLSGTPILRAPDAVA